VHRLPVLVAFLFTIALGVATVVSFVRDGVTGLGVVSACIVLLFAFAIVGVLRQPPGR
jgi:hypothetical protein